VEKLIDKEIIPFIYSRIGTKYNNYLIDEFQDTSRLQWKNLYPLIKNSISVGSFNMAVGDGKQAIYRWRAGDVEIMENEVFELFENSLKVKKLNSNYRSKSTIVNFNNKFFSNIDNFFETSDNLFNKLYKEENVEQKVINKDDGYVEIKRLTLETKNKKEKEKLIANNLIKDIKKILDEDNKYSSEDIAILVRKNKEGSIITESLFEEGINVVSSDSLLLKNSRVVRFIISVLKYISQKDDISLLNIYYFYKTTLDNKSQLFDFKLNMIDFNRKRIKRELPDRFVKNTLKLSQKPIYEIVEKIINIFELSRIYGGFLQGFLDVLFDYSLKNRGDISSFLNWWNENKDSNKCSHVIPETKNAVTVSTVHKAKGLEFPIVFVPFSWKLSESSGRNVESIWVNYDIFNNNTNFPFLVDLTKKAKNSYFEKQYLREQEKSLIDNINLQYVAFTRPENRLYIYTKKEKSNKLKTTYDLINKITDEKEFDFDGNEGLMYKGKPVSNKKLKRESHEKSIDNILSSSWRNKITIRRKAKNLWKLNKTDRVEKVDWGILVHNALERIKYADEIEHAAEEMVAEGFIPSSSKDELIDKLKNIL